MFFVKRILTVHRNWFQIKNEKIRFKNLYHYRKHLDLCHQKEALSNSMENYEAYSAHGFSKNINSSFQIRSLVNIILGFEVQ